MKKRTLGPKLHLTKETLRILNQNDVAHAFGGNETKAFTGCAYCSVGTSCDPDHSNFSAPVTCVQNGVGP